MKAMLINTETITNGSEVEHSDNKQWKRCWVIDIWINYSNFGSKSDTAYLKVAAPRSFTFSFAKSRSISGGSYIQLHK